MKTATTSTVQFTVTLEMHDDSKLSLHLENRRPMPKGSSMVQQLKEVCFQMLDLADQLEPPMDLSESDMELDN